MNRRPSFYAALPEVTLHIDVRDKSVPENLIQATTPLQLQGAVVNPVGMVAPVQDWRIRVTLLFQQRSPILACSLSYVFGILVLPALLVASTTELCRLFGQLKMSCVETATGVSYALVPLGASMWLAH